LLISSLPFEVPTDKFNEIANLAIPMLHNAVRAFVDKNPDLARTTMASEPRVNQVRDGLNADLVEWRQQGRLPLEALPPMITVARRSQRPFRPPEGTTHTQQFVRMGLQLLVRPRPRPPASACGRKLSGEPDEVNPHVRFDEGSGSPHSRSRPLSYSTGSTPRSETVRTRVRGTPGAHAASATRHEWPPCFIAVR